MNMSKILLFFLFVAFSSQGSAISKDDALKKLKEGNARFVSSKSPMCFSDQNARRKALTENQKPFAVILGCSDSRVPPEILFDQGIGDLFIIRVAGNVLGPSEIDSMTYAVQVLGCQLIVVLGHENCGAVDAVLKGKGDLIPYINKEILPALDLEDKQCTLACQVKNNVRHIVEIISKTTRFSKDINDDKLLVTGAFYPFVSGKVEFLK
jgi:carbonic anhydrase